MNEFRSPFIGHEHYEHRVQARKVIHPSREFDTRQHDDFEKVKEAIMSSPDGLTETQRQQEFVMTLGSLIANKDR